MEYSKTGQQLTESFESCRLVGYLDVKGVPTVGWGHTGPHVYVGMVITQEQADMFLLQDLDHAIGCVNQFVKVSLTQGEFDALVDFAYNCGCGAFAGSTMLKLLNLGDYDGASQEFQKWDHAAGQVVAGLLRRRIAERDEFRS